MVCLEQVTDTCVNVLALATVVGRQSMGGGDSQKHCRGKPGYHVRILTLVRTVASFYLPRGRPRRSGRYYCFSTSGMQNIGGRA